MKINIDKYVLETDRENFITYEPKDNKDGTIFKAHPRYFSCIEYAINDLVMDRKMKASNAKSLTELKQLIVELRKDILYIKKAL